MNHLSGLLDAAALFSILRKDEQRERERIRLSLAPSFPTDRPTDRPTSSVREELASKQIRRKDQPTDGPTELDGECEGIGSRKERREHVRSGTEFQRSCLNSDATVRWSRNDSPIALAILKGDPYLRQ